MTVEEAISRFEDEINGEGFYNDNEHRNMAVKTLKKEKGIKPHLPSNGHSRCRRCGCSVIKKYCANCGKKIDWRADDV